MGALLAASFVEGFVFRRIPHVVSVPGELQLQLATSDAAEFPPETLGEFFRLLEIVDVAPAIQLVAVAAVLCAQRHQPARERTADTLAQQSAAARQAVTGLYRLVVGDTDGFLHCGEDALRATPVVKFILQSLGISLLAESGLLFDVHGAASVILGN